MTVTLDGGALWELVDDSDPLLAVGDTVTITRAALGSYLMQHPDEAHSPGAAAALRPGPKKTAGFAARRFQLS